MSDAQIATYVRIATELGLWFAWVAASGLGRAVLSSERLSEIGAARLRADGKLAAALGIVVFLVPYCVAYAAHLGPRIDSYLGVGAVCALVAYLNGLHRAFRTTIGS